jgi:hypothetical protein
MGVHQFHQRPETALKKIMNMPEHNERTKAASGFGLETT